MKAADLYRLMESPALLTEDTLQQLKQIVDEFPYFQIARMLYLKNLAVLNDIRFGAELKKMAIYVPDRRKLFTLIEGERFGLQLQSAKEENPTREDAFSLIDAFLSNREEEEPKTDASLLFQPSVSSDYIYWSLTKENGQVEEKEEEEDPRDELVRRLLEYKMYKYAASELKDLELDGAKAFYKKESIPAEVKNFKPAVDTVALISEYDINLERLNEIFKSVMRKQVEKVDPIRSKFKNIEREEISLEAKMAEIREQVRGLAGINFRTLLEMQASRSNIIVTFLAILELMKIGAIQIRQEEIFGEIIIDSRDDIETYELNSFAVSADKEDTNESASAEEKPDTI